MNVTTGTRALKVYCDDNSCVQLFLYLKH